MTRFSRFKAKVRQHTGLSPVPFSVLCLCLYFGAYVLIGASIQLYWSFAQ